MGQFGMQSYRRVNRLQPPYIEVAPYSNRRRVGNELTSMQSYRRVNRLQLPYIG